MWPWVSQSLSHSLSPSLRLIYHTRWLWGGGNGGVETNVFHLELFTGSTEWKRNTPHKQTLPALMHHPVVISLAFLSPTQMITYWYSKAKTLLVWKAIYHSWFTSRTWPGGSSSWQGDSVVGCSHLLRSNVSPGRGCQEGRFIPGVQIGHFWIQSLPMFPAWGELYALCWRSQTAGEGSRDQFCPKWVSLQSEGVSRDSADGQEATAELNYHWKLQQT